MRKLREAHKLNTLLSQMKTVLVMSALMLTGGLSSAVMTAGRNAYQTLIQERADLTAEARAAISAAIDSGRQMTEEEEERDSEIDIRLASLNAAILLEEKQRDRERTVAMSPGSMEIDGINYAKPQVPDGGFVSFGEHLLAVAQAGSSGGIVDPRLKYQAASGASEGVGADGGFLVGEDVSTDLLRNVHETGILLSRTTKRQISATSNRIRIHAINETSRVDGSRLGGIQVYRDGEGETITASKPGFNDIELEAKKATGLFYATDELLMDAPMLAQEVGGWFTEEFGFKFDDEILNGNGVAQMLGILQSAALVTVGKETSQAAATVESANIFNMWSRCWGRSRPNAAWFINQDIEPQLFGMSIAVGTGGVPVYMPANGISGSPFGSLMGRPVIPVEQCATLGTVGDIIFADLSQYIVAEKGGVRADTSIHVKFLEDEMAFRFIVRNDGKPRWKSVLTPAKGSNTLSPFVALATRG